MDKKDSANNFWGRFLWKSILTIIILSFVAIYAFYPMSMVDKGDSIAFKSSIIKSTVISKDDIQEVKMIDSIPDLSKRVGLNLGSINKGTFDVDGYGRGEVFSEKGNIASIYIKTKDKFYIINSRNEDKNIEWYNILKK